MIPPWSHRKTLRQYDEHWYKEWNRVVRFLDRDQSRASLGLSHEAQRSVLRAEFIPEKTPLGSPASNPG